MSKSKHIVVLGAGVVGVTTAWYLRQAGYDVTVVDRQAGVAEETSKANGGQISVSHAEPWASPQAPKNILSMLRDKQSPLRFHPSWDKEQLAWCHHFLKQCASDKHLHNIKQLITLGNYSRDSLKQLRDELDLHYQQRQQGIIHFYTDTTMFTQAQKTAAYMQQVGCDRQLLSINNTLALEPALASITNLCGATYTEADESGNAYLFTKQLAQHCKKAGVTFIMNSPIIDASYKSGKLTSVSLKNEHLKQLHADKFVLCLGSFSTLFARKLGITLQVYPAKGYSATFNVTDASKIPQTSLIDDAYKLVFSRFTDNHSDVLRVAGMAEIQAGKNKHNRNIDPSRAALIRQRVATLFPEGLALAEPNYWTGLRPTTPSNIPYICQSVLPNLYLNTGHGTLGWTHACGSARLITAIIQNHPTDIDLNSR